MSKNYETSDSLQRGKERQVALLKIEDVYSFLITDDKVKEFLRRAEILRNRWGFRDYVAKFGFYDLGELTEGQLFSFASARNTSPIIDLLRIPRGKDLSASSAYAAYDLHRPKTSLTPSVEAFMASAPSSDQEWEILRDPEDIPHAIPEDLLLRRRAPREFLRRLTEGELIRMAWLHEDVDRSNMAPKEVPEETTLYDQQSAAEDARPFGYLLLDASESMGSARDRRDEVARGLALAYLLSQFESGNPTQLYLFRHDLSPAFGGEKRVAFESAVSAILAHSHEGMTNLQSALKLLAGVMSTQHKRVDIALITDGVTRLTENPLGKAHLHTFLVGARPEELDPYALGQYQESVHTLQGWSDFMFRITPGIMETAAVPRREDVLDFGKVLYGLEGEFAACASPDKVRRVQARVKNLNKFISRYRSSLSSPDWEVDALWKEAQEAANRYGAADPVGVSMKNANQWSPLDRDLMVALEVRELRSSLDAPNLDTKWGRPGISAKVLDPLEALQLIWQKMLRWLTLKPIRRRLRRVLAARRPIIH